MANLVSTASGNWSAAASWAVMETTSFLNSEAASTATTTSFVSSAAFTPGAVTIDGIGLKILSRSSGFASGTFSVRLANAGVAVTGTTVTTNAALSSFFGDIQGWIFFKFSAPVTLSAATAYTVQVQSSVAGTVTVWRNATAGNWSRFLRLTTTQAPVAADYLVICGEQTGTGTFNNITITMDNTTATNYSGGLEISANGILNYGTTASTNYQLRLSNNLLLNGGGTLQIGTSGTPIPSTSTANLEFIVASNVQFGLNMRGGGTLTTYGNTKTGRAYLNADASAAATTITTDISTGWKSGDKITIASTTTTAAQTETVTLSSDATGTSVPISALGFAHSGTSPYKAEIININRNVRIFGQSTTLQTYILISNTATVSMNYTEHYFMGSVTANKRGVDIQSSQFGNYSITGCAYHDFAVASSVGLNVAIGGTDNTTISDCVFSSMQTIAIQYISGSSTGVSFTNCWALGNTAAASPLFVISSNAGTVSGCVAAGSSSSGFSLTFASGTSGLNINNCTSHSNASAGFLMTGATSIDSSPVILTNLISWRNVTRGVQMDGNSNLTFDGLNCYANTISGVNIITDMCNDIYFKNCIFNGGVTPVQPSGILFSTSADRITIDNSTFGVTTTHTTGDIDCSATVFSYIIVAMRNCLLNSTTPVANTNNLSGDSFIGSSKHQQTTNSHFGWFRGGTIKNDTVIYDTTSITSTMSNRMTFANLSAITPKSPVKRIAIINGKTLKVSVAVRLSVAGDGTAFLGQFPRLIVRKNAAVGITSDTVLATTSAASIGAFETITGTTIAATDNGVLEFFIDFRSPITGWANLDTWKVEVI